MLSAGSFRRGGRPSDVTGHVIISRRVAVDDVDLGFPSAPVEQVGVSDGRGRSARHVTSVVQ